MKPARIAAGGLLALVLLGCGDPATQVLLWVELVPGSALSARASELRVQVYDQDRVSVLDETRRLKGEPPLQTLPASISLLPRDDDASRVFRVQVSLLEAGPSGPVELIALGAEASFVAHATRELRLRFDDVCLGVVCGDGRSCVEGQCRRDCYATSAQGEVTRSMPGPCPCRCSCAGDSCMDGVCLPAHKVSAVSAGAAHACALDADGGVWCWGSNSHGQLGSGDLSNRPAPNPVALEKALAIAAGPTFSCVALQDGTTRCFGEGARGQLGLGSTADEPAPIVLLGPGAVPVRGVIALGAGGVDNSAAPSGHACGVLENGDVWCWGQNEYGQLGLGGTGPPQPPGRVMTSLAADNMATVELGGFHSCARQRIGRLWCWGQNHDWQLGFPDGQDRSLPEQLVGEGGELSTVIAAAAGTWHGCAVSPDGRLWCWGEDAQSRTGLGSPDGVDVDDIMMPTLVLGELSWSGVAAGHRHSCAIDAAGSLWCFGTSAEGELGVYGSSRRPSSLPIQLKDEGWESLSLGTSFSCAVRTGGALYCWGRNQEGQLGAGEAAMVEEPQRVCLP